MKYLSEHYSKTQIKIKYTYICGFAFLFFSAIAGIMLGSTPLSVQEIWQAILNGADSSPGARIFAYVRLPRVVGSVVCGAALAVAGAVIQNVLANKLASPGIIGVNSGAGLAVTLCTVIGAYGSWQVSVSAFVGAFASVMLVSLASHKLRASRSTVILFGVAMNSFLGAISDTLITFVPDAGVMSNGFKVGEFSAATLHSLIAPSVLIAIGVVALLTLSVELDVLCLGEDSAKALGMNTHLMQTIFLLFAALLAGCAVSVAGLLSFVGLIVPHAVRRFSGGKSFHLILLCAIFGGGFVSLCDTLARTVFSPYEIPVGIIMSFLGAPFFVAVLINGKGGHHND